MGFPVWSRHVSAFGCVKETLGSVNVGVVCAGQWIEPGDVVVADDDGVVVVPRGRAAAGARRPPGPARQREAGIRERYRAGELGLDMNDMRERLARQGPDLRRAGARPVIIDCHGHYTTAPAQLQQFRDAQLAALDGAPRRRSAPISDDELRESVEGNQLRILRERGGDLMIFSPQGVGHGAPRARPGDRRRLGAGEQRPGRPGGRAVPGALRRRSASCRRPRAARWTTSSPSCAAASRSCGFVGANLNPDPSGGFWTSPPLTDPYWFPVYEALVELDVPAMVHVSSSCNPNFHALGAHYLNADTSAFMQLLEGDLFERFPTLRLVIPHGGGAVPVPLGPLPRAGDAHGPAGPVDAAAQRLLRHLRLPPAGHRPADPRHPDGEHPVRLGDARRRARRRPRDRHRLGRHEAVPRRRRPRPPSSRRRSSRATPAASTPARRPPERGD